MDETKICRSCGEEKLIGKFYPVKHKKSNGKVYYYHSGMGKKCDREDCKRRHKKRDSQQLRDTYLRNRYGITLADYAILLEAQDNKCAICGTTKPGKTRQNNGFLFVDHCHETGEIRGLLCRLCNLMLGWYEKNQEGVATYLGGG